MKYELSWEAASPEEHDLEAVEELAMRALFERRAEVLATRSAPPLEQILAAVREDEAERRDRNASATRVALALVACCTAFIGSSWLSPWRGAASIEGASGAAEVVAAGVTMVSLDEPLACAFPVSGFVRTSERAPACAIHERVFSVAEGRAVCEDAVTSSVATP